MVAPTPVWVVVVIVVAAGVGGAGFFAGYEYRGSPAAHPGLVENRTLSLLAAGTLNAFFPTLAGDLASQNPGITAPAAAQSYKGSLQVASAISSLEAKVDVAAVADFRLIPSSLEPTYAGYEVVFASTPEVLVYNSSIAAFHGLNTTNWGTTLASVLTSGSGVPPFAVWNASTDPNGYNEIFAMMLQGMVYGGGNASVYGHFYSGTPGGYANPVPKITLLEPEAQAASLLKEGIVSSLITYRSYAIANGLSFVPLDPIVGLQANTSTALADYAKLTTEILSSGGELVPVHPAPVLFAATVPRDAPNATLGAAFLHLLVSPEGGDVLSAGGAFTPLVPAWTDDPAAVPPVLAPDVVALPSWASGFLA